MKALLRRIAGRRRIAGLLGVLTLAGALAIPVLANLTGSGFDAGDGNLVLNDEAKDWVNAPNFSFSPDKLKGEGDNAFGEGTSEDDPVPNLKTDGIPPNKSDITRFYQANETVSDKTFIYLAWERVKDPTGTTNFDFELNQSKTLSANGATPVRTPGDVLIKYDLANGGSNPVLGFHRWIASAGTQSASAACEANSKFPCWDKVHPIAGANFEAAINGGDVTDPIPPDAPRTLGARTFGEAAVNLTDAGILPAGDCTGFASAYLKSRSSDAFNSAIKDFASPLTANINNCKPVTIKLKKVDPAGKPLGGATMQLFKDNDGSGTLTAGDPQVGSDCTTTAADGIGNCSFDLAGASSSNGTYIGHEKSAPPGYKCCADDQTQAVTIDGSTHTFTLTFEDLLAPGKIEITKTDDAGNPLKDAVFTLYKDVAPIGGTRDQTNPDPSTGKTCTTVADGTCTISNVDPGDYWVVETTNPDPSKYETAPEQSVNVPTGTASNTGATVKLTFKNPRKHRVVVLVCHEGTDSLAPSAVTFDGGTPKQSLSGAGLTAAQQKALCDTGGASFGGIAGHPTKSASIDVGSAAHAP